MPALAKYLVTYDKEAYMPHVLIIHEAESYQAWKTVFDQPVDIRKRAGEISYQLPRYDTAPAG